jgi:hypothetical protein
MSAYRANLEQVRIALPALLKLFANYGTRATWATVGAIGCESWTDYFSRAAQPPRYANSTLCIKSEYAELDPKGELHFAPELIRAILRTRGQELGSHTFSHLYLRERGMTAADVAGDLKAVSTLFTERFGITPISLVFPRNQPAFLDIVRASGITVWRGNPGPWYYECEDTEHNGPLPRALKLIDGLNPLRRMSFPLEGDMTRASLFLRLNLSKPLWAAHLQRVRGELKTLRPGQIFTCGFTPITSGKTRQFDCHA